MLQNFDTSASWTSRQQMRTEYCLRFCMQGCVDGRVYCGKES